MRKMNLQTRHLLALCVVGIIGVGPALADRPSWAGGDKGDRHEQKDHNKGGKQGRDRDDDGGYYRDSRDGVSVSLHIGDRQRTSVREYYREEFRGGNCPPGLAKKHNGCMPPGQAKKWSRGRPLPRDVEYYDLPPAVLVQLGAPPAGHRYVRVASDILLIAIGSMMVADAIEDLGR